MSIEDNAVVEWIVSFDAGRTCEVIDQLWDGVILAQILHEIVPESFTMDGITQAVDGKWVLAAKNIRTILKSLDEYFTNQLAKKIRVEDINENNIAKNRSSEEIIKLVELIVGVAVFCDQKQVFIGKIFELSSDSQTVLKGLVQHVMESAEDLAVETSADLDVTQMGDEEEVTFDDHNTAEHSVGPAQTTTSVGHNHSTNTTTSSNTNTAPSEELLRSREMLAHLQQERSRLLGDLQTLEHQNEQLKQQVQQMQLSQQQSHTAQHANTSSAVDLSHSHSADNAAEYKHRFEAAEQTVFSLRRELEETKSSLDLRMNDVETLRQEARLVKQKWEAAVALQTKAEMEARSALDELDLARAKADRLFKVEQQLEKAQSRLEEMVTLRRTNKELNDRLDTSLDKIHDLESSLKEVSATQRNLETARAKNIEMERRLFEAESLNTSLDEQVKKLREDVWKTIEKQRSAEDEARSLRMRIEVMSSSAVDEDQQQPADSLAAELGAEAGEEDAEEDSFFTGNAATLRQRLRDTHRQLRQLQRQLASDHTHNNSNADSASNGGSAEDAAQVMALHQEMDNLKRQKKERDDLIHTLQRQLRETESECDSMRRSLADRDHTDTNASRDSAQRLAVLSSTVARLEERLTERELLVTRLETEKNKLETYAKRSLMAFKEKFMSVIQTMKEEKRDLEVRVKAQAERTERSQEAWRREERLLSAALFEVGVKIMDRKIHANLSQQHQTPGTDSFLTAQREAVSRASTINVQHQQQIFGPVEGASPMSPEPAGRRLFNQSPGN